MLKYRLVSKKLGSGSLKRLAEGLSTTLGYKVFRSRSPRSGRKNLVYGDCKDKLFQYEWFAANEVPALPFTTSSEQVAEWLAGNNVVFARTLTRSSEGKGIIVLEPESPIVSAPVYTLYRKKKKEFRVHVYKDQIVAVLEKRKKKGLDNVDSRIRNTANGYVFCRDGVVEPEGLRELALKASKVTNSDFKGVDIGYNEKLNQLFCIEVNSAPGMEGSTINQYIEAILQ